MPPGGSPERHPFRGESPVGTPYRHITSIVHGWSHGRARNQVPQCRARRIPAGAPDTLAGSKNFPRLARSVWFRPRRGASASLPLLSQSLPRCWKANLNKNPVPHHFFGKLCGIGTPWHDRHPTRERRPTPPFKKARDRCIGLPHGGTDGHRLALWPLCRRFPSARGRA